MRLIDFSKLNKKSGFAPYHNQLQVCLETLTICSRPKFYDCVSERGPFITE
jgi:hypothetical protein